VNKFFGLILTLILTSYSLEIKVGNSTYYGVVGYDFSFEAEEIPLEEDAILVGRSRLDYPLSFLNLNLGLSNSFDNADKGFWEFILTKNLVNPAELMIDDDWVGSRLSEGTNTANVYLPFSHTESKVDFLYQKLVYRAYFKNSKLFYNKENYLGIQFTAEYLEADVKGVESGWQGFGGEKQYFSKLFTDTSVIKYESYNLELSFLSQIDLWQGDNNDLNLRVELSPLSYLRDKDDHMLRGKASVSSGWGGALGGNLLWNYHILKYLKSSISLGYFYRMTWGEMKQEFYADDPGTSSSNEKGLVIEDIDNKIYLKAWRILFDLSYEF
jgi:hypothetical protein